MYLNSFLNKLSILIILLCLASCDKDYNTLGGDLIDTKTTGLFSESFDVLAYNKKTNAVQADNFSVVPFGIYNNPNFGETTASFAVQLSLPTENIDLGDAVVVDSVAVSIPYFIDATQTRPKAEQSSNTYVLDSIYGTRNAKMKLSVYKSGYTFSSIEVKADGTITDNKKLYSDETNFEKNKGDLLYQNTNFAFKTTERVVTIVNATDPSKNNYVRSAPEMEFRLDDSFQKEITGNPSKLLNNTAFKEFFKGLYFKIEKTDPEGEMAMLDLSKARIRMYYKNSKSTPSIPYNVFTFAFGKTVSLQKTDNTPTNTSYAALPKEGNITTGDPKLYLKGGEGSLSVITLFSKPGELDALIADKIKINQANLVFNIDAAAMATSTEPNRVYLFDLTNNLPIADYVLDRTGGNGYPKNVRYVYNGFIKRATTGKGTSYAINITNHVRDLIQKGKENVKLGLVVTEDINNAFNSITKTDLAPPSGTLFMNIPTAGAMSPLGTVLFGSAIASTNPDYDKRLKLQIYYTKPN